MINKEEIKLITTDELESAHDKMQKDFDPIRNEYQLAKKNIEDSFNHILNSYYDQNIIDADGVAIQIGNKISNNSTSYLVINRGMQIIFGKFLYNNSVKCNKINKDNSIGKKEFSLSSKELLDFNIII